MLKIKRAMAEVLHLGVNEGKYLNWSQMSGKMADAEWRKPYEFPLPDKLEFRGYEEGKGSIQVIWGKDLRGNQVCITDDDAEYCLILQNVEDIYLEDEMDSLTIKAQVVDAGYGSNLCSCLTIPVTGGHAKKTELSPANI